MKLLFVSPDLTHHLVPFFTSLFNYYGKENCTFAVLATSPQRLNMGFPEFKESWVFEAYNHSYSEYSKLWQNADIIITRSWNDTKLIEQALNLGKIVFYASERWYRPPIGIKRLLFPKYIKLYLSFRKLSKYKNFNYLAMGYYAGLDFKKVKLCRNRIFSFGYFTPQSRPSLQKPSNGNTIKLIWVGNMLKLKRVIDILYVYKDLQKKYNISLDIIGEGAERNNLENYSKNNKLSNIRFIDFIPNDKVKELMNNADIYIFLSNGYEGWGAVVNEAMQSKCAVIASQETGAARSIIKNNYNGLTYPTGNREALKLAIVSLLENNELLNSIKENGYNTIRTTWSAEEAARRFSIITNRIKNNETLSVFEDGPMQIIG